MANSATKTVANGRAEIETTSRNWAGLCLMFVRIMLGVSARYASAIKAWQAAKMKHAGDRHPPKGAPAFYEIGKFGHIVISDGKHADGETYVISTDIKRRGKPDVVPLGYVEEHWGARYLGWTEDLNGVRVVAAPKPAPKLLTLAPGVRPKGQDPQVMELQRLLIAAGYGPIPHAPTDHYGPETRAAVARFHKANPKFAESATDEAIGPKGFAELQRQAVTK